MPTVGDITAYLDQLIPSVLAEDWDNVGLLLGDANTPVQRLMTCLTVTPETAAEAMATGAQMIVTHHPILFRGIKRLTAGETEGNMVLSLARAGIAVYSPHTAFDNAGDGINDILAGRLSLSEVKALRPQETEGRRQCKIVVFVPEQDLERVADALFAAGAGHIGEYKECSFRLAGTGTFFGSEASNPTIGAKGRREQVNEWRLEAICPEAQVETALAAMRRAHSYEEPAYDVYPLRPTISGGAGRLGRLPRPTSLDDFARVVKAALGAGHVQVVGDLRRQVQRLAIACGAGGEFLPDALRAGADVFLTGELRFHDYLTACAAGLALVLPGHYASERCGIEDLARRLQGRWPELQVWPSQREQDPVTAIF